MVRYFLVGEAGIVKVSNIGAKVYTTGWRGGKIGRIPKGAKLVMEINYVGSYVWWSKKRCWLSSDEVMQQNWRAYKKELKALAQQR